METIEETRTTVVRRRPASAAAGGIIAGLFAGAVLTVLGIVANLLMNRDIWVGLKGAALPFLGPAAVMRPGFDAWPVVLGLVIHFTIAAGWGLLFGLIATGVSRGITVLAGAVYGLLVWLGMFYIVLPLANLGLIARAAPVGMAVFEHVIFGLCVGIGFLPFQAPRRVRWLTRRVEATP